MNFKVQDYYELEENTVYLCHTSWDDWFRFETEYEVYLFYKDKIRKLGLIKIGQKNQVNRKTDLQNTFNQLPEDYFSVASTDDFYVQLNSLKDYRIRNEILKGLNDIAYNNSIYEKYKNEDVMCVSLMRDVTESMILGQWNRIANGGARLTDYSFTYTTRKNEYGDSISLNFDVMAESKPPTNIHTIIGKNGVGKTTLLKNMVKAVIHNDSDEQYGTFNRKIRFSNLVFVSFSAFDLPVFEEVYSSIPYSYVGLIKQDKDKKNYITGMDSLGKDFSESLFNVAKGAKKKLWDETLEKLNVGNAFEGIDVSMWADNAIKHIKDSKIKDIDKRKNLFYEYISNRYNKLSSGHKVILLILVKLVDLVEEKTLVIIDEPEEHLHPPLVSAFIRALSELLIYRNGVAIIATHSPVIVQEIPKKCVWKIRRNEEVYVAERPRIETFGENLGEITADIFEYEVLETGFHEMLKKEANKKYSYRRALRSFNGELGQEGRAMLKSFIYMRDTYED